MFRATIIAILTLAAALAGAAWTTPDPPRSGVLSLPSRHTQQASLDGLNETWVPMLAVWYTEAHRQDVERQAAEARARARQTATRTASRPQVTVTGDCQAMKPAGFPDYIIQRESGGDPNARNPSGAYGCAQLMPGTGGSGSYAERWARTWAGGAGACHWNAPNYCAG